MPADHYIMDSDMKQVADAIRSKGGTTAQLTFPNGMVQAINDIQTGGGITRLTAGCDARDLAPIVSVGDIIYYPATTPTQKTVFAGIVTFVNDNMGLVHVHGSVTVATRESSESYAVLTIKKGKVTAGKSASPVGQIQMDIGRTDTVNIIHFG